MKKTLLSALLIATTSLVACQPNSPQAASSGTPCTGRAYTEIGGPIHLTNQNGDVVTEADFKGKSSLLYFGFTNCPDVCPFTLQALGQAMDQLPEGFEKPRTILISVDPEQDTPEVLGQYISSNGFPKDIVGLTGTPEEIQAAAKAFKTSYKRVEAPDSELGYTMDHLSIIYYMDEDWKLKTFFASEATPSNIASCLVELDR